MKAFLTSLLVVSLVATGLALPPQETTVDPIASHEVEVEEPEPEPIEEPAPEVAIDWRTNPEGCTANQWIWPDGTCHDKATASQGTYNGGVEQWRALVSQYNWNVNTALAIMQCESSGNAGAVGDTTTAYSSYGLFQIRALPGRPSPSWLLVPENNVQYAYQLYSGQGWHPWTCYYKI